MSTESVNTKTVAGRRAVHFQTLDELLAEAERLSAGDVTLVGNWSLGQIFGHLARSIGYSIDGFPMQANWLLRFVVRTFFKKRFLTKPLPAGFQIPRKNRADFIPEGGDAEAALNELRAAVARFEASSQRAPHPFLGGLTDAEWRQLHCRHGELHMSFAVPRS